MATTRAESLGHGHLPSPSGAAPAMKAILQSPLLRRAARTAADWVDLQWSLLWEVISEVAPRARGRLLDVGCGQRPYEVLFRPYVTEYIGIEHEATFARTNASTSEQRPDL